MIDRFVNAYSPLLENLEKLHIREMYARKIALRLSESGIKVRRPKKGKVLSSVMPKMSASMCARAVRDTRTKCTEICVRTFA